MEPVGFHWPDNPEEEKSPDSVDRRMYRIYALSRLISEGYSPRDAVDKYLSHEPERRSTFGVDSSVNFDDPSKSNQIHDAFSANGQNSEGALEILIKTLYANASNRHAPTR